MALTALSRGAVRPSVFTLQQGKATQTISVKMEQVLASELAARTFGQVATSQLEDVCGAAAAAEPVATAYARHFRVTGRTCSLLMLESEQDYARFNIKPEEDSFVVKDRPAGPIVAKVVAEATAAMGDPKASFLAWYRRVRESSEVHFDLPASLDVALEGLPAETFAVTAPPLQCKLRFRKDLPENLRQPWQIGPAGLRNAGRRGPAALDGLRGRRRLAGPELAGRGSAGRRGPGPRSGLLGHRVAAARRGLSPPAAGRRGADLRADHLPRHGPLPGADGPGRPGDRLLRTGLRRAVGRPLRRHAQHRPVGLSAFPAARGRRPREGRRWPIMPRPGWPRWRPCSFATRPTWPR